MRFTILLLTIYHLREMHDTNLLEDQPIAWTPTPDVIELSAYEIYAAGRRLDVG